MSQLGNLASNEKYSIIGDSLASQPTFTSPPIGNN